MRLTKAVFSIDFASVKKTQVYHFQSLVLFLVLLICSDYVAASERVDAERNRKDNIIGERAYSYLWRLYGEKEIPIDSIIDKNDYLQRERLEREFGRRSYVNRNDILDYVRKQFDLLALEKLGGISVRNLTAKQQDQEIKRHLHVLRNVSQAMINGRFNPYEDDVNLVFLSFANPSLSDPRFQQIIKDNKPLIESGPHGKLEDFAMYYFTDKSLSILTGKVGFEALSDIEKKALIKETIHIDVDSVLASFSEARKEIYRRIYVDFIGYSIPGVISCFRHGQISTTDINTWNGRYGSPTAVQLFYTIVRGYWFTDLYNLTEDVEKFRELFGKDNPSLPTSGKNASINDALTENEIRDRLSQLSEKDQDAIRSAMSNSTCATVYGLLYLGVGKKYRYSTLRKEKYLKPISDSPRKYKN